MDGIGSRAPLKRIYEHVDFSDAPDERPYVFLNMVATIDGKTISGERSEPVMDLGSKADHQALRDLESHADGVMVGAQTLRATPRIWFDNRLWKVVVTKSANLPWESRFFTDDPARSVVLFSGEMPSCPHESTRLWKLEVLGDALRRLKSELGIRVLALEGGSELNSTMLSAGLVDEVFLTLAPKMKLGRDTPTIAGGEPLSRDSLLQYRLVSCTAVENEVFLRYKVVR